ncbi:MAG: RNA 3'-terminal phosphate cyclase [Candidatus Bathyarchaeota archaeon]|nr:RNA 3'-terminal phosphate cyclase [Candidatus Bathyarchaeota archaeon]
MLEIDGSQKSGSGTILRLSVALSAIIGEPLHICNIRHKRRQPGLRPQHLESVVTAAKLCNAQTEGAQIGSSELWFTPNSITTGEVTAEIGTAGSISMLLLTVLPICAYSKGKITVNVVNGGTDVRFAPTINYLKYVLLPTLEKMGLQASLTVKKYGYYPKGMGEATLTVNPCSKLKALNLTEFDELNQIQGVSVCTFLEKQQVAQRQANEAKRVLNSNGYDADIQLVNDKSNLHQKGSSIALWANTTSGSVLGADAIGELRKTSEAVGNQAAENLVKELKAEPTVDVHLADMLVPYVALADGGSSFVVREVTDHIETNVWLVEQILGTTIRIKKSGNVYNFEKC